jgi:hypothetical protein
MLPIRYHPVPGNPGTQQFAPDVLAARVDPHFRSSYRLEEEGIVPAFVLEVISPESRRRDTVDKRRAYEAMGVEEYLLFDPVGRLLIPRIQGYRREGEGWVKWEQDEAGRLWSEVFGAWLTVIGDDLRLMRRDGTLEPSPAEEALAREQAEIAARGEALAREQAEEEIRRLEAELARLRASLEQRDSNEG